MSEQKAICELCGEPMPDGEEIFKFHGYSGECPKPPKSQPKTEAVIEYVHRKDRDRDELWLDIRVNGKPWAQIGPFDTEAERQRIHDDMLNMMRSIGARDLPSLPQ